MFKDSITENVRVLQDVSKTGRERPWRERKQQSRELAALFYAIGDESKGQRVGTCGNWLTFASCPEGHEKRLMAALFCQLRLCPMCAWRRSLKVYNQLNTVLHVAVKRQKMRFIFLTLTAESVTKEELSKEIDRFFKAWKRLTERKAVKDAVIGWFRALEVTRDNDKSVTEKRYWDNPKYYQRRGLKVGDPNPNYGRFHPHFHCLLAVPPSYFGVKYIPQEQWVLLWKKSLRVDYSPVVDVRTVKAKKEGQPVEGAVAEAGKYSVKPGDYLLEDPDEAAEVVEILDRTLRNRRLVAYGGLFREIRKELNMTDPETENADLVNIDEDGIPEDCRCSVCQTGMMREVYKWHIGLRNYVLEEKDE